MRFCRSGQPLGEEDSFCRISNTSRGSFLESVKQCVAYRLREASARNNLGTTKAREERAFWLLSDTDLHL